jgi:hypothetical protein
MGPHSASHTLPDDDDDLDDDFDEDEDDDEDGDDDDDDDDEAEGAYRLASRHGAWLRLISGVLFRVGNPEPAAADRRRSLRRFPRPEPRFAPGVAQRVEPLRIPGRTREFHSEG